MTWGQGDAIAQLDMSYRSYCSLGPESQPDSSWTRGTNPGVLTFPTSLDRSTCKCRHRVETIESLHGRTCRYEMCSGAMQRGCSDECAP
jgi:hypothetical protein